MIERLAENNAMWLRMAYDICGNRDLAKDLVQEMYLKLYDCEKEINIWYVYRTMKNDYLNQSTRSKEIPFAPDADKTDDNDNWIFDKVLSQTDEEIDYDNLIDIEVEYETVKAAFNELPWHEREVIKQSYNEGLRKFARESNICVWYISKTRKKLNDKVWQQVNQSERSKELEISLRQSLQQLASLPAKDATSERIFLM